MNINPSAKRILCYGDSNTWGCEPSTGTRYPIGVRWTSLLQINLGDAFEIIEEGMNNRTTNIDDPNIKGVNGLTYLVPCLKTHDPIDLIVLMLGSNDMKESYNKTPEEIVTSVEKLLEAIQTKVLLVSPPLIDESVETIKTVFLGAEKKSKKLGILYNKLAKKHGCEFIDLSKHVKPSKKDGGHLDPKSHKMVANVFANIIIKKLK